MPFETLDYTANTVAISGEVNPQAWNNPPIYKLQTSFNNRQLCIGQFWTITTVETTIINKISTI